MICPIYRYTPLAIIDNLHISRKKRAIHDIRGSSIRTYDGRRGESKSLIDCNLRAMPGRL